MAGIKLGGSGAGGVIKKLLNLRRKDLSLPLG